MRIFAERSPVPTSALRLAAGLFLLEIASSRSLERSICMALWRFLSWLRSSWQLTDARWNVP